MGIAVFRSMWKDWGFAPSLFAQAKRFLELAKSDSAPEGNIRAAIVFSLMAFEAYWTEAVKGYIQANGTSIAQPTRHAEIVKALNTSFKIKTALETWPEYLVGKPLDTTTKEYDAFSNFREYRNCLVHGKVAERIPRSSWGAAGMLVQDVETTSHAELVISTVSSMIKTVALHFGFHQPSWT